MLVCGPPCAGKTTYVDERAAPDAEVIDFDQIARALGSPADWQHPEPWRTWANSEVERRIRELRPDAEAWVIRCLADRRERAALAAALDAQVVLLDPGEQTCLRRAASRPSGTRRAIRMWYWRARS